MFNGDLWLKQRACELWDALVRALAHSDEHGGVPTDAVLDLRRMLRRRRRHFLSRVKQADATVPTAHVHKWISCARDCALYLSMAKPVRAVSQSLVAHARRSVQEGIGRVRRIARGDNPEVKGAGPERTTFYHWAAELRLNLLLLQADPAEFGIGPTELADLRRQLEERLQPQPV
jgi:hypothetical protein